MTKCTSFFCELIDFRPYIQVIVLFLIFRAGKKLLQYSSELRYVKNLQHSSYDESVMELVENSEVYPGLDSFRRASALEVSNFILTFI